MSTSSNQKLEDFSSFWKHYDLVQAWVAVNNQVRSTATRKQEWRSAEEEVNALLNNIHIPEQQQPGTSAESKNRKRKRNTDHLAEQKRKISDATEGKGKKKKKKRSRNSRRSTITSSEVMTDEEVIEVEDVEMDDEMMEFFRISMEHKQRSKYFLKKCYLEKFDFLKNATLEKYCFYRFFEKMMLFEQFDFLRKKLTFLEKSI